MEKQEDQWTTYRESAWCRQLEKEKVFAEVCTGAEGARLKILKSKF